MNERKDTPVTVGQIFAWGGAAITLASMLISAVVAFERTNGRCDLLDQRCNQIAESCEQQVSTLRSEREDLRKQRDQQYAALSARNDNTEHNVADITRVLNELQTQLAELRVRSDDTLKTVQKIDDKINGGK